MKDTIITAKIPYNILFEGMNQDNMCVFRILSKKKKGFDRFMSYLKGRKSEMNPDISKYKVISWLIDNSPVYIKEQEVENDYVITTVIYDYFNFRSFGSSLSNLFTSSDIDREARMLTMSGYYKGNGRIQFVASRNIQDMTIEFTGYDRLLRVTATTLLTNIPEQIADDAVYMGQVRDQLKVLDKIVYGPAIKLIGNYKKEYTHNSIVKVIYKIYDDVLDSINIHEPGALSLLLLGGTPGPIYYGRYELKNRRVRLSNTNKYVYKPYGSKYRAAKIGNKLVYYDGARAFDSFKDKIGEWDERIQIVVLMQYHGLEYAPFLDNGANRQKVIIRFLNPKDYTFDRQNMCMNGTDVGEISGRVWNHRKAQHYSIRFDFRSGESYNPAFEGIVPFGEKAGQVIDAIDALIKTRGRDNFSNYIDALIDIPAVKEEEDILTAWFTSCVKTKKHNDDNVLRAYRMMKLNLLREYKALEDYMGSYDFSRVTPVPKIILDKKTKENYYKSLHILAKNIKINNVNNKKIKEINKTQAMVDLMYVNNNETIIKGSYPLIKYYNPTSNTLEFNYNKMKGELIHDKVKNRG